MHESLVKPSLVPVPPLEAPHPPTPSQSPPVHPPVQPYAQCPLTERDVRVILAFFSPAGFTKPRQHMNETVRQLAEAGIPHLVVEAGLHRSVQGSMLFATKDAMFFKENLWNLGARRCDAKHLVFLDGDVEFSNPRWLEATVEALADADVVQPYTKAVWLKDDRTGYCTRGNIVDAIRTKTPLDLRIHHPGFGWAMTREAFEATGGWYDQQVLGAGDTAFAVTLDTGVRHAAVEKLFAPPSYVAYRQRVNSLGPRVRGVPGTVYHRYHGAFEKRQYDRRYQFIPELRPDGELPVSYDDSGLLRWDDIRGHELCKAYFLSREEDT